MKDIVEKLIRVERDIAKKRGPFLLFALFLREEASELWDLLISAPWIIGNKEKSIKYIADHVRKALKPEEILKLSRIVIIEQENPALNALHRAIHIEHGKAEVQNSNFFGMLIKHAYIITSQRKDNVSHEKLMQRTR
jgi:hypothetical protein